MTLGSMERSAKGEMADRQSLRPRLSRRKPSFWDRGVWGAWTLVLGPL